MLQGTLGFELGLANEFHKLVFALWIRFFHVKHFISYPQKFLGLNEFSLLKQWKYYELLISSYLKNPCYQLRKSIGVEFNSGKKQG